MAEAIAPHVHALRINVRDDRLPQGSNPVFVVTEPQMEAAVQLWVDTAYPPARAPIEAALATVASRIEGWLVAESTPLPNRLHPPGQPTGVSPRSCSSRSPMRSIMRRGAATGRTAIPRSRS
ncbi:hypothetical protein ACFSTI_11390 [Rhizorhabdus histidinilytica]